MTDKPRKNIGRRTFLAGAAAGTAAMASASCASKAPSTCPAPPPGFSMPKRRPALADLTGGKKPNILMIMTDQERHAGNLPDTLQRPHFGRLRKNAVAFDNAFCAYPLCSPSRSAVFTGLYPHQTGVTQNMIFPAGKKELDPAAPHIGSVLAALGYRICYKGKWDLNKGPTYYMVNLKDRGRAGPYGFEGHCGKVPDQEYGGPSDEQAVKESCRWISDMAKSPDPWFLCCSIVNPHDICHPMMKPDDSVRPDIVLPESRRDDLLDKPGDQLRTRESKLSHVSTALNPKAKAISEYGDRDWELYLSFYYDLIELTDGYIGRLFAALEDSGQLEDTVVIYHSDHGELGGAHGMAGKYEGYEEDLHIPLYVHHPGLERSSAKDLVCNTSIAPTIASLAGGEWPSPVEGVDLCGHAVGDPPGPREAVFAETETDVDLGVYKQQRAIRMVRTGRYKYSYSFFGVNDGQLYDLDNDPIEMVNLFHDPGHASVRKELEAMLRKWMKDTGDRFELPART